MNESFRATIAFALLALTCIFVANLCAWLFKSEVLGLFGVLLSVVATGFAWLSQQWATHADYFLRRANDNDSPVIAAEDPWLQYLGAHRNARIAQWSSVGAATLSLLCLLAS